MLNDHRDRPLKAALLFAALATVGALIGVLTAPHLVSYAGGSLAIVALVATGAALVKGSRPDPDAAPDERPTPEADSRTARDSR